MNSIRTHADRWHWLLVAASVALCVAQGAERGNSPKRQAALNKLCERLEIGKGAVVADIGCGQGDDTLTFAEIVGKDGTVLAEEIGTRDLDGILRRSRERGFRQVVPVLGHTEDPRLPNGLADLAYMRHVFHHFARPRMMLEHLWFDVKPGGHLVIADRQKGPLRDPVPLAEREKEHHWTGETVVVRVAREAGFEFQDTAEDLWYEKDSFVLVFRRPIDKVAPDGDPDLPLPLDTEACLSHLPLSGREAMRVAFVGLDGGRVLLPALREALGPTAHIDDIVIEEWALDRDEVPDDPAGAASARLRTLNGDLPMIEPAAFDAVVFGDAYHRLWEPTKLLSRLRSSLQPGGFLAIVDRRGPAGEERRLAGHRRRIAPEQVRQDLEAADFVEVHEWPPPAQDRFFLLFRPRADRDAAP